MSFTRVNPGGWAFGALLTHDQTNALDTDHANAIDKTGDTIAPSSPIVIGGSGLSVTGTLASSGAANLSGAVTCSGTVEVSGSVLLVDHALEVASGGGISLLGTAQLIANGATSLIGATAVSGALTCTSSVDLSGAGTCTGPTTWGGNTTFTGVLGITGGISLSGAGTIQFRTTAGVDADHTFSVHSADIVVNTIALSAGHTWKIDHIGVAEGTRILFTYATGTGNTVLIEDAVSLSGGWTLGPTYSAGVSSKYIWFTYTGGSWVATEFQG